MRVPVTFPSKTQPVPWQTGRRLFWGRPSQQPNPILGLQESKMSSNSAADRLMSFVLRIETLDEEKRALMIDIAEVKKEAKSAGFDTKVITQMLKERRMSENERQEWQALCETYRAALGMLDGTPLSDKARKRLLGSEPKSKSGDGTSDSADQTSATDDVPPAPTITEPTAEDLIAAQAQGAAAAKSGRRVTENPHPFDDKRRAAWDEGFCAASGSDGMDVPPAWRRASKKSGSDSAGKGDS